MSDRWNYIRIFTRLSSLLGGEKFNLILCDFAKEKNNNFISSIANTDGDHIKNCISVEATSIPHAMNMVNTSSSLVDMQYFSVLICTGIDTNKFLEIISEDNDNITGGFALLIVSDMRSISNIPMRSKFIVGSEIVTGNLRLFHLIRSQRVRVQQSLEIVVPEKTTIVFDEWFSGLTTMIGDLLNSCENPCDVITRVSTHESWKAVFTHVSYNPDPMSNYETMETLGDKVMSLVFVNILVNEERKGTRIIDPNLITDIHKEILSRSKQKVMGEKAGFDKFIRSTVQVDDAIIEDVTEAFFGNLFSLGNSLSQMKQGFILCSSVFKFIFAKAFPGLNIYEIKKDPQTVLDQMFQKLGWGHPEFTYDKSSARSVIKIPEGSLEELSKIRRNTLREHRNILSSSDGMNKKDAERKASLSAIEFLKTSLGIDQKYIKSIVKNKLMLDSRYSTAHSQAMIKAEGDDFSDIYVQRKSKHRVQYYIVTGIRRDDTEQPLFTYRFEEGKPEGNIDGQVSALLAYSRSH